MPSPDESDRSALPAAALEVAREAAGEEFEITKRLEDKGRGLAAVLGLLFTVIQGLSAPLIAQVADRPTANSAWVWVFFATVAFALLFVGGTLLVLNELWRASKQGAISLDMLEAVIRGDVAAPGGVEAVFAQHMVDITRMRRESNKRRADALHAASTWWSLTAAAVLIEAVVAVVAFVAA